MEGAGPTLALRKFDRHPKGHFGHHGHWHSAWSHQTCLRMVDNPVREEPQHVPVLGEHLQCEHCQESNLLCELCWKSSLLCEHCWERSSLLHEHCKKSNVPRECCRESSLLHEHAGRAVCYVNTVESSLPWENCEQSWCRDRVGMLAHLA